MNYTVWVNAAHCFRGTSPFLWLFCSRSKPNPVSETKLKFRLPTLNKYKTLHWHLYIWAKNVLIRNTYTFANGHKQCLHIITIHTVRNSSYNTSLIQKSHVIIATKEGFICFFITGNVTMEPTYKRHSKRGNFLSALKWLPINSFAKYSRRTVMKTSLPFPPLAILNWTAAGQYPESRQLPFSLKTIEENWLFSLVLWYKISIQNKTNNNNRRPGWLPLCFTYSLWVHLASHQSEQIRVSHGNCAVSFLICKYQTKRFNLLSLGKSRWYPLWGKRWHMY